MPSRVRIEPISTGTGMSRPRPLAATGGPPRRARRRPRRARTRCPWAAPPGFPRPPQRWRGDPLGPRFWVRTVERPRHEVCLSRTRRRVGKTLRPQVNSSQPDRVTPQRREVAVAPGEVLVVGHVARQRTPAPAPPITTDPPWTSACSTTTSPTRRSSAPPRGRPGGSRRVRPPPPHSAERRVVVPTSGSRIPGSAAECRAGWRPRHPPCRPDRRTRRGVGQDQATPAAARLRAAQASPTGPARRRGPARRAPRSAIDRAIAPEPVHRSTTTAARPGRARSGVEPATTVRSRAGG